MSITLITGGAKSGKSDFAELLIKSKKVSYIATNASQYFDIEMQQRVKKHRIKRNAEWHTEERFKNIAEYLKQEQFTFDAFLIDCATMLTTNLLFEFLDDIYSVYDFEQLSIKQLDILEMKLRSEWNQILIHATNINIPVIIVTNEVGLSIVPEKKLGRWFQEIFGKINQEIARNSEHVYFVTCGISQKLK